MMRRLFDMVDHGNESADNKIEIDPENEGQFAKWCKTKGYKGPCCGCVLAGIKAGGKRLKQAMFVLNIVYKKNGKECKTVNAYLEDQRKKK